MTGFKLQKVTIDISTFKIKLSFKSPAKPFEVHFNTPNRKFYCALVALIVNANKKLDKFKYVKLDTESRLKDLELVDRALLKDRASPGNTKRKEKCRKAWHTRLRNAERASLFKVLNREIKNYAYEKSSYVLEGNEGDIWADLFLYDKTKSSWHFKFAADNFGLSLEDVVITYDSNRNNKAWDLFLSDLKLKNETVMSNLENTSTRVKKKELIEYLKAVQKSFKYQNVSYLNKKIDIENLFVPIEVTPYIDLNSISTSSKATFLQNEKSAYMFRPYHDLKSTQKLDWSKVKADNDKIVLLGDPGTGKSTILQMEVLLQIEKVLSKLLSPSGSNFEEIIIPLYFNLAELANDENEIFVSMLNLQERDYPYSFKPIKDTLLSIIKSSNCILLLDAIDEVPHKSRIILLKKLDRFLSKYTCRIICTSRIVGYYSNFISGAIEFEIVPFEIDQIRIFSQKWYNLFENSNFSFRGSSDNFLLNLENNPQLLGIAQNPLILSMLCILDSSNQYSFPKNKISAYQKTIDYFFTNTLTKFGYQSELILLLKFRIVEEIAYYFSCKDQSIFNPIEIMECIYNYFLNNVALSNIKDPETLFIELSEKDGIFTKLSVSGDNYIFFHRTIQEFLTASYISRIFINDPEEAKKIVTKHLWSFQWHETIALLSGIMESPATLLQVIIDEKDDIFYNLLILAGRCLPECTDISHSIFDDIFNRLVSLWNSDYLQNVMRNVNIVESTLINICQAHPHLSHHFLNLLKSSDEKLVDKALRFLCEIGDEHTAHAVIKDHLDKRRGASFYPTIAIKKLRSDRIVDLLSKYLKNLNLGVRLTAVRLLTETQSNKAVSLLIKTYKDLGFDDGHFAITQLDNFRKKDAVLPLITALKDDDRFLRSIAAGALGNIKDTRSIKPLIQALSDADWGVRSGSARSLGYLGNGLPSEPLHLAFEQEEWYVRDKEAIKLCKLKSQEAVYPLILATKDDKWNVRNEAVIALGRLKSENAVQPLTQTLKDEKIKVICSSLVSLGLIGHDKVFNILEKYTVNNNLEIRSSAIKALGNLGDNRAVDLLINILKTDVDKVRAVAAEALGEIGNIRAVRPLTQALQTNSKYTGPCSLFALSKIGDADPIEPLIPLLGNKDEGITDAVVNVLTKIGDKRASTLLLKALNNDNWRVRYNSAAAIGMLRTDNSVKPLIQLLKDSNRMVRISAAEALGNLGNVQAVEPLLQSLQYEKKYDKQFAANSLKKLGSIHTLKKLIEIPGLDLKDPSILLLTRSLAIRYYKEPSSFIPVYPEITINN